MNIERIGPSILATGLAVAGFPVVTSAAILGQFGDRDGFNASTTDQQVYLFSGDPADLTDQMNAGLTIEIAPGLSISTTGNSRPNAAFDVAVLNEGLKAVIGGDEVTEDVFSSITFHFDRPVTAFAAEFRISDRPEPVLFEAGGDVIDGQPFMTEWFERNFTGFASDTPFTELTIVPETSSSLAVMYIYDITTAVAIPEPAGLTLLVGGAFMLRRRRD